jgi:hypothetical protein
MGNYDIGAIKKEQRKKGRKRQENRVMKKCGGRKNCFPLLVLLQLAVKSCMTSVMGRKFTILKLAYQLIDFWLLNR